MKNAKTFRKFLNEQASISMEAVYINQIVGSGQDATQNFIDDHAIDAKKLADYVKNNRNTTKIYDVRDYISGAKGTVGGEPRLRKSFIKLFKESVTNDTYSKIDDKVNYTEDVVNEKMKVFLKKIISDMVSGAFGIRSSIKMKDELASKMEDVVKDVLIKYDYIVESKEADALAKEINTAMIKIDDSMSYKDFAVAVATILRDEYGTRNYMPFIEELKKNL